MKIFVALLTLLLSGSAFAAKPYNVQNIMLLQPDFVLSEVVKVEELSDYIKSVNRAAEATLSISEMPVPSAGFVVLAVRPGGQSKVWLDFSPALSPEMASDLLSSLERVAPFKASGGVVVFALNVTLWEGSPVQGFPNPPEWSKAMEGRDDPWRLAISSIRCGPAGLAPNNSFKPKPLRGSA